MNRNMSTNNTHSDHNNTERSGGEATARYHDERLKMTEGNSASIATQHAKGKATARERIAALTDSDSFIEQQGYIKGRSSAFGLADKRVYGDGVVSGSATVGGRQVHLAAQDFTVLGGSLGEMHAIRIAEAQEASLRTGTPFIQINDSGGARIQEGILSLQGYGRIFKNNTLSSGVVPQLSVILGPCAGGAVYSPAITDFIFMADSVSQMYITGPDVIRAVTGENVTHKDLGGAVPHSTKSGVAHFHYPNEESCLQGVRKLLEYLPLNNREHPPVVETADDINRLTPELDQIIPSAEKKPYDIRRVINTVCDSGTFLEIQAEYAPNVVIGFARMAGRTVGFFANQTQAYAAALDINASDKGARFLRFCDAFNIPIVTLVDVPGFLPGVAQEHGGIIRHGAKILYAIAEATVPKIALILRKSFGGAYISMSCKSLGYDRVIAYPTSQIAVMGAEGAANIIFRREIKNAENSDLLREEKIREYREGAMNPYQAAQLGCIDDIIHPANTRVELIRSLGMNMRKREERPAKKHGNIPL